MKVPERIERWRLLNNSGCPYVSKYGDQYGVFVLPGPHARELRIIVAPTDQEWQHVSVSIDGKKLPSWNEMCWVKDLFWEPNETVVQFHPDERESVNNYEVLHLWRNQNTGHELPPSILVGVKDLKFKETNYDRNK